jgi:hypothetical protein
LRLTDLAEALARPLLGVLEEIEPWLRPSTPFDPTTECLHLVVTAADYVSLLLALILAEICATEAPNLVFEFTEGGVRNADDLQGGFPDRAPGLRSHPWQTSGYDAAVAG